MSRSQDDIDPALMQVIDTYWERLQQAWDAKYPENPVSSADDKEDTYENSN